MLYIDSRPSANVQQSRTQVQSHAIGPKTDNHLKDDEKEEKWKKSKSKKRKMKKGKVEEKENRYKTKKMRKIKTTLRSRRNGENMFTHTHTRQRR